jgi:hypothetical protein
MLPTERRKLLTRARGILLDNELYTVQQVKKIGLPGLLKLKNMGPKAANLVVEAVARTSPTWSTDLAYLFPYPRGIDVPIRYVPTGLKTRPVTVHHLHMLGLAIARISSDWAMGYAQAIADLTTTQLDEAELRRRAADLDEIDGADQDIDTCLPGDSNRAYQIYLDAYRRAHGDNGQPMDYPIFMNYLREFFRQKFVAAWVVPDDDAAADDEGSGGRSPSGVIAFPTTSPEDDDAPISPNGTYDLPEEE